MVMKDWKKIGLRSWLKECKKYSIRGIKMATKIINVRGNPHGYKYNVQIWKNNYYTGNGKFFKTKTKALAYARAYMRTH